MHRLRPEVEVSEKVIDAIRDALGADRAEALTKLRTELAAEMAATLPETVDKIVLGMAGDIGGGWRFSHMDGGRALFRSPEGHRLSLTEAVGRGLLRAVRTKRGHTREEAARAMGVSSEILGFWEEAERTPGGLSLEVIEQYLMGI